MKSAHRDEMKSRRRNICLVVAYDGTRYHGFQRQTPPVVAVQNVLEERLRGIFGDEIEMAAAGRTDAGVHAYGQVVNFFTDGSIPTERIPRAAESVLPPDIVVKAAYEAPMNFSALHSAKRKTYSYRIMTGASPDPITRGYAWHLRGSLDLSAMAGAARLLIGTHDFSAFRASGGAPISPVRTMDTASCAAEGSEVRLTFRADGFLYRMARNIVGTLALVGAGRLTADEFFDVLSSRDRKRAGATAPARGLYLMGVEYDLPFFTWKG